MLFLEVSVSRCPLDVHTIKYSALRLHLHWIQGLIKRYPDINAEHLIALLSLREDMAKTNVRKVWF
jgi:hypothetical protein